MDSDFDTDSSFVEEDRLFKNAVIRLPPNMINFDRRIIALLKKPTILISRAITWIYHEVKHAIIQISPRLYTQQNKFFTIEQ